MLAIVGGLGAALSWAVATLASSRSSRMIGPPSVIGWVMIVGLGASIVPAVASTSAPIGPLELVELLLIGVSYSTGLLLTYAGLAIGRVSIVTPIVATEGAVAAVVSVALGEQLPAATAIVLAIIAAGVVLAAVERTVEEEAAPASADRANQRRAVGLALTAAAAFSVGLVLAGKVGAAGISPAWVIVAGRGTGTLAVAVPLALRGGLRLTRPALPLVIVSGLLEALGSGLYVIAASVGIATAAVLSSQFAAIASVTAFILFGERLQRVQVAGVVLIAVGVTVLAAVRS
jgi:drug/metabolite transporter (DMT)-like permease